METRNSFLPVEKSMWDDIGPVRSPLWARSQNAPKSVRFDGSLKKVPTPFPPPNTGGKFLPYEPNQQFEDQTDDQECQPKHRNASTNKTPNQKQYARCKGAVRDQMSPL
jgi:hypothetical protein